MARTKKPVVQKAYSIGQPFVDVFPFPVVADRAPTTTDKYFLEGQDWIYKSSPTAAQSYTFGGIASTGDAIWIINGPGASEVDVLTGDTGGAIAPTAGNINILGGSLITVAGSGSTLTLNSKAGGFPITPFVVGTSGQAGYQTIAAALTAASSAGGTQTIYIQPGTYTENLTLVNNVSMVGVTAGQDTNAVIIVGTHTPPTASGATSFRNITFQGTTSIFSSLSAGNNRLICKDCNFVLSSAGFVFQMANWVGQVSGLGFEIIDCGDQSSADSGFINNSAGGAGVGMSDSNIGAGGGTQTMAISGQVFIDSCEIVCPMTISGGTGHFISTTDFRGYGLTVSGSTTGALYTCNFVGLTAAAFTQSSSGAWTLSQPSIGSSNNPAIAGAGAGVVTIAEANFISNAAISGSLSVTYAATKTGALTVTGLITGTASATIATGATALNLGADASTGAINLGTGAGARTIIVGNATGATSVALTSGSGGIALTATNAAITLASGTGTVGISADATANTINIATGAGVKALTLGSTNTTSASTLQSGSGGIAVAATNGAVTVTSGTGALGISTDAAATTVSIATGAAAKALTVGSTNTTSATTIQSGSGGIAMTGVITAANNLILNGAATQLRVHGGAATDFIGTGTLSSGTVTVLNTNIAATDRIFLQRIAANGATTLGELSYTISAATSFTVTSLILGTPGSTQTADTSTFAYFIVRQV